MWDKYYKKKKFIKKILQNVLKKSYKTLKKKDYDD